MFLPPCLPSSLPCCPWYLPPLAPAPSSTSPPPRHLPTLLAPAPSLAPPLSPQAFAPSGPGAVLELTDLLEEEEAPSASGRAVDKVLMVYNSELRALYDKCCK